MTGEWSAPAVVRDAAARWWRGGRLLRELHVPGDPPLFPARVRLVRPSGEEIADRYADVRAWADRHARAAAAGGWAVETRRVPVRALGAQEVPSALVVPDVRTALALLGPAAVADAEVFAGCLDQARDVRDWAVRAAMARPLDVVAAAPDWSALLDVARWMVANPRPGVHIRAIPVPGVHTKLVESRRALLGLLLSEALDPEHIDDDADTFEGRFGFATGERSVVLRAPGTMLGLPHLDVAEVTWPLAGLGRRPHGVAEVVVVENRVCLAMVPWRADRCAVWGAGYGAGDLLRGAPWLADVDVVYWGDLDTHGLAILSEVRGAVPQARSILMDVATLDEHRDRVGVEPSSRTDELPNLRPREEELWERLRRTGERLEQEHIAAEQVAAALA